MQEKAYKLLSVQENISNNEAKKLIDDGLVFASGKRIKIARANLDLNTKFKLEKRQNVKIIAQNKDLIVIDKPYALDSYTLEKQFNAKLIHRLDKTTSGVILLAKNDEFLNLCIEEFKALRVQKEYLALVQGIVPEPLEINLPIKTIKKGFAKSFVDKKGKTAHTKITPLEIRGKTTLLKVEISTGRTHQIRVHLAHMGFAVVGDVLYGAKEARRIFLHSHKISILGNSFESACEF